ncbi:NlpC/P60 family protein [Pseudonocardiaceae bacterium YIM PH 21723]|nr:NlpC/P60 family protein [Pseudonocardiaceae bacterium YIM PH 21723]
MIAVIAFGGIVMLIVFGALAVFLGGVGQNTSILNLGFGACTPALALATGVGNADQGRTDATNLGPDSLEIVGKIIIIGKQRNIGPRGWQVAIQAGRQESGLKNLTYGDRDSLGIFQMRPSMGWGTVAQVTNVEYQINKFYDVLLGIPEWEKLNPGDAAQLVERSAFPFAYARWESMAAILVAELGQVADFTGCAGLAAPTEIAKTAIAFAKAQLGKPYGWGDTGPNSFDCSGLMLRAFEAAGIKIMRVANDQYDSGVKVPVKDAQPGDMLFYSTDISNSRAIHHVVMYLGNDQLIEAPTEGQNVSERKVNWNEPELMPYAVRPGA